MTEPLTKEEPLEEWKGTNNACECEGRKQGGGRDHRATCRTLEKSRNAQKKNLAKKRHRGGKDNTVMQKKTVNGRMGMRHHDPWAKHAGGGG